ncbi:hypothetical protein [Pelagibius sp. Alg239-R121]|uniref:hypothetical protein n=1 Tax=Pelagibius sp. Alg239-R121 TaxID=2993448 RepID=UPI0024A7990B|nr:hypothetical protein [Pelagibius sp. Alg239-R121]
MPEVADISLPTADLVKIRRRGYHALVFGGDSPRSIRGSRDAGQEQQHRAVIARGY